MPYIIKAEHASDSSTPKKSHTVSDITVKSIEKIAQINLKHIISLRNRKLLKKKTFL